MRLPHCLAAALIVVLVAGACTSPPSTPVPAAYVLPVTPEIPATPIPSPTFSAVPTQAGFLTRQGSELTLQGQPFREISFNKFDLFEQFVEPGYEHQGEDGVPAAAIALSQLHDEGYRVVRIMASPYYPAWFDDVFFDDDPQQQDAKRRIFFQRFDAMLDECDRNQIRVVADLVWNIENLADLGHGSLEDGFRKPDAPGRARVNEYIRAVVSRYRDRPTIAMWEIGNEWNLFADLQKPEGVISGHAAGDSLHPGPVVRDARNNFTSDDLAAFYKDTALLIRSIDENHLISTGASSPRPAAMHLLLAARAHAPVDWTPDDAQQLEQYLEMMNPDPVDVISIHYYDEAMTSLGGKVGSPDNLRFFAGAAQKMGKPLFIGEIGLDSEIPPYYDSPAAIGMLKITLPVITNLKIPLTLYWTFNDDVSSEKLHPTYVLRAGRTDEALELIEAADEHMQK
jgi:hypothetical protein